VSSPEVIRYDLIVDGDEGLIHAITAFTSGFEEAKPRLPFVCARGSVAGIARLLAHESSWENVHSASKQGAKQADLASRRIWSLAFHAKGEGERLGRCVLGCSKLRAEQFDLCPRLLAGALNFGQSRLLDGKFLKDGVFRAHHRHILSSGRVSARAAESGDRSRTSFCDFIGVQPDAGAFDVRPKEQRFQRSIQEGRWSA